VEGWKGQKGVGERWAPISRGVEAQERKEGRRGGVEVHDGSLPPPIPTAGGSFSRGLYSRDHQAFSGRPPVSITEKRREPAASAYGAAAPRLEGASRF